jgi:ribosomal protein S18 acetylase RimI-like enzyme
LAADFRTALTEAYCEQPCQVLPNALWKTLAELEGLDCIFCREGGSVSHLEISGPGKMLLSWDKDRSRLPAPAEKLADKKLALVHQDYVQAIPERLFASRASFYRLKHQGFRPDARPEASIIRAVRLPDELDRVADFLNRCYVGMRMTPQTVLSWTRHLVYDPRLWIWIESETGQVAGLGIAEFDAAIREGSLEWIQVLPAFRRQGFGRRIVCELLWRLDQKADFTTVSGRKADDSGAERLYRSCGFEGNDIWWALRNP